MGYLGALTGTRQTKGEKQEGGIRWLDGGQKLKEKTLVWNNCRACKSVIQPKPQPH